MRYNAVRSRILFLIGALISACPPILATLLYFPLWQRAGSGASISGISLLLLLIAFTPIMRILKRIFASPSAPLVWFCIFIAFYLLSRIANEVTVIAFVGFISNLIGSFIFNLSKKRDGDISNEGEA